ncbi:small ribosomal subunit protein mS31 [Gastrophryne carolinensis]
MYRRAVCGGRAVLAGAVSTCRYSEHSMRWFSIRSVYCSDKSPPENNGDAEAPKEEQKANVPPQEESSQPPNAENLLNLLSAMKVEVSANKKFQAVKKKKITKQTLERMEGLESASKMFQSASKESHPEEEKTVSPELKAAASAVASTFPDQKIQVESELLQQLRLHKQMAEAQRKGDLDIKNVISGMTIKKQPQKSFKTPNREDGPGIMKELRKSSQGLFTNKRLRIFPVPPISEQTTVAESSPSLWDIELAKDVAAACEQPPKNGFEEMIQWTNEGKLWTFPINNEAGFDEEQNVEFHEHIFLEKYLEDFPNQGPIRHFIELVICGLSKNPYLTVQQKKEHIDWFRDYFHKKEDILRESEVYLS